jgi:uncharacterized protein with beta-barrel porin domain
MFGTTFRYQDPLTGTPFNTGALFNSDGTNSNNPVIAAPATDPVQQLYGSTHQINLLSSQNTITFKGNQYTVYSAVPQDMTISYAYQNVSPTNTKYYDPASLTNIDFTIPTTINGGNSTALATTQPPTAPSVSPYTGEKVYLTTPPTDSNSLFFIPNLPNNSGGHSGLTANIYFVGDPFIGKPGYMPSTTSWPNGKYHLTPYGWASNPTFVNQSYFVQLLNNTGGQTTGTTVVSASPPYNFWKHTIQGSDASVSNLATQIMNAVQGDASYPFPPGISPPLQPGQVQPFLNWLYTYNSTTSTYTMNGIYLHVQPQPGFQRNLLRYYTAWGAVDVYNQASDLFVRSDGTIELPAVNTSSDPTNPTWTYAPVVTQTWDGSQRYTLLNLTSGKVPSTYDDYPGYEYYLPGNVYLPGQAGVVTSYVNYLIQDNTGLTARQTDLWLGLQGDSANDILFWADAPVSGSPTEPGGQGNKPYMFGASTYLQNSTWNYNLRLQSSNSFCVARLASTDLAGKLYDASFYADLNNGKGYQKAATITYQWQPWTINDTNGKWKTSTDSYGAGVMQLKFADTLGGQVGVTSSNTQSWDAGARVMTWSNQANVDPSQLSQYNNSLTGLLYEYFATGTTSDANTKYLIVLNPRTNWIGGTNDWGTAGNWDSGVPTDSNNVYLEQNDGNSHNVTYNNTAAGVPYLSMLRVDGNGGMTLQVNSGTSSGYLNAEMAIVGSAGTGNLLQSAGAVSVTDQLLLGYEQTGTGTYTLQGGSLSTFKSVVGVYGTGTFTQSGGTHSVTDSLTLGAQSGSTATYTLTNGTLNTVNTIVGLNGSGTFTQSGGTQNVSGTLTLGSSGTYNLNAGGTLTVTNFVNQGTFNNTGGTFNHNSLNFQGGNFVGDLVNQTLLTGNGTITGTLTNSGIISPGNSPGTLNVVGNYIQTAAGTYNVEVASANSYDRIVATGTATLAGAIAPATYGGFKPRGNQVFPGVVTATGGIIGTFNTILNQQFTPTLFWQTRYNPNSVDLWVQRNYTNAGLALNTNQAAVGSMLNSFSGVTSGDLDTVLNAIDYLPDSAAVRDAYKQISSEKAGALTNLGFGAANFQMRNLANRTTNLRFLQGTDLDGSSLNGGGLSLRYSKMDGVMLAYNGASVSNLFSGSKEIQMPDSRWGLFVDGGGAFGHQSSSVNQTSYNFSLGGFTAGADYRLRDNLLLGLATGYSNSNAGFNGSGGNVNTNSIPFNAYVAYMPGSLYAYGSLGYALNLYNLKRGINFNGITRNASSFTTGNQFNLYGETGYDYKLKRVILTPSATLAFSSLWVGGFTEQGAGALNLKVAPQSATSLQTGIGGRVTVPLKAGSVKVIPQVYAYYQHEFANGSRGLNASLSQGSSAFRFQTDTAKRNYALVGGNVTLGLKKNLVAQLNYNAEVGRGNSKVQSFNAGLRWEF